jgi:hypothetical protein
MCRLRDIYSHRSAVMGSTSDARPAGMAFYAGFGGFRRGPSLRFGMTGKGEKQTTDSVEALEYCGWVDVAGILRLRLRMTCSVCGRMQVLHVRLARFTKP